LYPVVSHFLNHDDCVLGLLPNHAPLLPSSGILIV
jgi:hypothetical protein